MEATRITNKKQKWALPVRASDGAFMTDYVGRCTAPDYIVEPGVNYVMRDSIEIGKIERGDSAAGLRVQGEDHDYYMSVGNMAETMRALVDGRLTIKDGRIDGLWTFVKQGQSVSLTPHR